MVRESAIRSRGAKVLNTLKNVMFEPDLGNTAQHKKDRVLYETWSRKNKNARITSDNDIMCIFREYDLTMDIWSKL